MLEHSQKLLYLEDHERRAILSYCARTTIGFLSLSNDRFYGSGVLALANGTCVILTAAHVVTAVESLKDCKVAFTNDYVDGRRVPAIVRDYSSIACRVSNGRRNSNWKPAEIDIGIIVPSPTLLEGIPNLNPVDLRLGKPATNVYSAATAIILGFPERSQRDARKQSVIVFNPVYTQFIPVPADGNPDDIALSWDNIYQVLANKLEHAPAAGGMSGGPIFSYIRETVTGAWTAEKQLVFRGILHYQHPDCCLLGHSRQAIKDFVSKLLNELGDDDLRKALANGHKFLSK